MAIICQGILDGFSGKVGTVVGADWRNRKVLKAKPRFKRNRKSSDEQKIQRQKMQLSVRFMKSVRSALSKVLDPLQARQYATTLLSKLITGAFIGDYPDLSIDYSKISKGDTQLPLALGATTTVAGDQLQLTWRPKESGAGKPEDQVIILVYYPTYNFMNYTGGHVRSEGQATIDAGAVTGDELHVWLLCISPDGSLTSDLS